MRDLNAIGVAMIQQRVLPGIENRERNLERALQLIDVAMHGKGDLGTVDIVGLAETFATGFPSFYPPDREVFAEWGERLPDTPGEYPAKSTILGVLSEKAREHRVWIQAGSILETDADGEIQNTAVLLDDEGRFVGKYTKVQPWTPEPPYARATLPVFDTPLGVIGMNICYDGSFPEISRILALKGAEIIFRPSEMNDPLNARGWEWWQIENRARAIENHCYVVAVSCIKQDDIFTYPGCSQLVDPFGRVLIESSDNVGERVLFDTIDILNVRRIREEWISDNHMKDLRLDLYAKELSLLAEARSESQTVGQAHVRV
jgi:predicted amidohydrolase